MSAIDDQNAKQIRDAMDVVIQLDATATSYGDVITITNENLIRATVSLRSDLSIIEPTLPESEINVEAYWPEDVAEAVAAIPDDTPITYSAGYPGDMSPERKFYVSGQITWADNVLTIHGVDAVHFLEVELPGDVAVRNTRDAYAVIGQRLRAAGVIASAEGNIPNYGTGWFVIEKQTYRQLICRTAWLFSMDIGDVKFRPIFIDAGRPVLRHSVQAPSWSINEQDCGDVKRDVAKKIVAINYNGYDAEWKSRLYQDAGSFAWYKNDGVFLELDRYILDYEIGLDPVEINSLDSTLSAGDYSGKQDAIPTSTEGQWYGYGGWAHLGSAVVLLSSDVKQGDAVKSAGDYFYTQVVPWNCNYAQDAFYIIRPAPLTDIFWNSQNELWTILRNIGLLQTNSENYQGELVGRKLIKNPTILNYSNAGAGKTEELTLEETWGSLTYNNVKIFPDNTMRHLLQISNVTGSFRWKGDPRQQPRDVATFVLRDGTEETITLENITIQHEKGGTYADYTYRKGIV